MPLFYLRRLTGSRRTETSNRHLARYLAFIAGAVNAGGFLAVRQYTSHMTGIVSAMADNLALGSIPLFFEGFTALLAFLLGAFFTTLLVRWARSRGLESVYAIPLLVEAFLFIVFGLTGEVFSERRVFFTVLLLCFTMGLQNAIVTKLSNAVIRTTHLTGMVTDTGIALGRIASSRLRGLDDGRRSEMEGLRLLTSLIALFFAGAFTGAVGFKHVGFLFILPLAAVLVLLAIIPVIDDIQQRD